MNSSSPPEPSDNLSDSSMTPRPTSEGSLSADELVSLGRGTHLDDAEEAQLEALLASDADRADEAERYDRALQALSRVGAGLRRGGLGTDPVPVNVAARIELGVMRSLPARPAHRSLSSRRSAVGATLGAGALAGVVRSTSLRTQRTRRSATRRSRSAAAGAWGVAAILLLAVGAAVWASLPAPETSSPDGGARSNGDPSARIVSAPTPSAEDPNSTTTMDSRIDELAEASSQRSSARPLPRVQPRQVELVYAEEAESSVDFGLNAGLRHLRDNRLAGGIPTASVEPRTPEEAGYESFEPRQADVAENDAEDWPPF